MWFSGELHKDEVSHVAIKAIIHTNTRIPTCIVRSHTYIPSISHTIHLNSHCKSKSTTYCTYEYAELIVFRLLEKKVFGKDFTKWQLTMLCIRSLMVYSFNGARLINKFYLYYI